MNNTRTEFEILFKQVHAYSKAAKESLKTYDENSDFYWDDRTDEAYKWFQRGYRADK